MPYPKTQRKNKKVGEYKPKVSRKWKWAAMINAQLDHEMWERIKREP